LDNNEYFGIFYFLKTTMTISGLHNLNHKIWRELHDD